MERQQSQTNYAECYVFVDHSNLWIEGKKAQSVKDIDHDPRYRVDLGKFLSLIIRDRHLSRAFLYGSDPPPNDSVWKAAKEKNFDVKVFQRSGSGKEKELDVAMTHEITKTLYKDLKDGVNVTFITVTGDRDFRIPIEDVLDNSIPVELWSWEKAMARVYKQLANSHPLFQANILDSIQDKFSYTSYMSTTPNKRIDPACAIVFRGLPNNKKFRDNLANTIGRLMRLFYFTCVSCKEEWKCDFIVEFPKTKPDIVLNMIKKMKLSHEPCSYPEYTSNLQGESPQFECIYQFEASMGELDDDEVFLNAVESSIGSDTEEFSSFVAECTDTKSKKTPDTSEVTEDDEEDQEQVGDNWITYAQSSKRKNRLMKLHETPCPWKEHCEEASKCPYMHSEYEKKVFRLYPNTRFRYWKIKRCTKRHGPTETWEFCCFAHEAKDSWCLSCKMYGHFTDDCQVETTKASTSPSKGKAA